MSGRRQTRSSKRDAPADDDPLQGLLTLDRLVHEPARLLLLAHLSAVASADFVYLRRETGLTAGNISSHMAKLEAGGYVSVEKLYAGRRPQTVFRLTATGRRALRDYVAVMGAALGALS